MDAVDYRHSATIQKKIFKAARFPFATFERKKCRHRRRNTPGAHPFTCPAETLRRTRTSPGLHLPERKARQFHFWARSGAPDQNSRFQFRVHFTHIWLKITRRVSGTLHPNLILCNHRNQKRKLMHIRPGAWIWVHIHIPR